MARVVARRSSSAVETEVFVPSLKLSTPCPQYSNLLTIQIIGLSYFSCDHTRSVCCSYVVWSLAMAHMKSVMHDRTGETATHREHFATSWHLSYVFDYINCSIFFHHEYFIHTIRPSYVFLKNIARVPLQLTTKDRRFFSHLQHEHVCYHNFPTMIQ